MIKAIETEYRGHRFRSRTEARWAVFFDAAGIAFDYEREGVVLDGQNYLPDFWLSHAKIWFEVKGVEPTSGERDLCKRLAVASERSCLLAVGPPSVENPVYYFAPRSDSSDWTSDGLSPYYFDPAHHEQGEVWLIRDDNSIWFKLIDFHEKHRSIFRAYEAANSARFEYGESGPRTDFRRRSWTDLAREARDDIAADNQRRRLRYGIQQ